MKTGFLYFLPGKSAGDKLDLDALGLSHARAPGEPTKAPVTKGPDDGPGLLLVFAGDHAPRYVAAEQTWRKAPGGGHWVGVFNAHKPGPEDLAREQVIGGEAIRMLDGADWVIPICQSPVRGRPTVPRQLDLDDQGQWVRRVLPKYARVCEDAERVFHHWLGENWVADVPPVSLSEDEGWRIAADALAVNYRVSPLEIAMLRTLVGRDRDEGALRPGRHLGDPPAERGRACETPYFSRRWVAYQLWRAGGAAAGGKWPDVMGFAETFWFMREKGLV
jgi:hypothetical protein